MAEIGKEKEYATSWIDRHREVFYPYSDAIWSFAELGCEEYRSSNLLVKLLRGYGFEVEAGVAGMPTAFVARWGTEGPVIGINCEYDALAGLSQRDIPEKNPVTEDAPGHGCGHNILGVGSVMAAVAIKEWLPKEPEQGDCDCVGSPGRGDLRRQTVYGEGRAFPGHRCVHRLAPMGL